MKKFRFISVLLILSLVMVMPVYAHNVELDSEGIITMPNVDGQMSGQSKVVVSEKYGEYNLHYQYVVIADDVYESYNTILEEQRKYQSESLPGEDASDEEKNKYTEEMAAFEKSKQNLLPVYNNANWKTSTDDTVPLDTKGIDSEMHYVLWVRITKKTGDTDPVYQNKVVIYKPNTTNDTEESPSTGDNTLMLVGVAAVIGGIMVISYKKLHA